MSLSRVECPTDPTLQEDLERIAADPALPVEELRGSAILITGATGLVGSQLVRALACLNRVRHTEITILALVRNPRKAENIYGNLLNRGDINLVTGDITRPEELADAVKVPVDYILHGAAVTNSKLMVTKPVETIATAVDGTRSILELARSKQVRSMVYLSSMEVYGHMDTDQPVTEEMQGYVNPLTVRSNYPLSKRMCENLCAAYQSEYQVPVRIARLAYNVTNEEAHTTIAAMAAMAAERLAKGRIHVTFDIPETNTYGYAAETHMLLSGAKLRALGWQPSVGLEDAYRRMIESMKAQEDGQK